MRKFIPGKSWVYINIFFIRVEFVYISFYLFWATEFRFFTRFFPRWIFFLLSRDEILQKEKTLEGFYWVWGVEVGLSLIYILYRIYVFLKLSIA